MKALTLFVIVVSFAMILSGCSASYVDKEFGKAQMTSFDKQIAYPDYRYTQKTPTGMEGILAEEVMQRYTESYREGFSKQKIDITDAGMKSDSKNK